MTNYEKYKDEIIKADKESKMRLFIERTVPKARAVNTETYRNALFYMWLQEEYEEPKVDWTKVKIDTKIFVRESEQSDWKPRYFAGYDEEFGDVYAWDEGATSWSCKGDSDCMTTIWRYAKLAGEGE